MLKRSFLAAVLAAAPVLALAPSAGDDVALARALDTIETDAIRADIEFLADDEMAGRDTPSEGLRLAARYIRARLMRLGFQPAGDHGYFDEYKLNRRRLDVERSRATLTVGGDTHELAFGKQYVFSDREVMDLVTEGDLVFVGDGSAASVAGLRLDGSWALAVDSDDVAWRDRRDAARQAGAIGLVVTPSGGEPFTRKYRRWVFQARSGGLSLGSETEEAPFAQLYLDPGPAEAIVEPGMKIGTRIEATLRDVRALAEGSEDLTVENVCGLWPGSDPELKNEVLIVSAHYDHVGTRGGEVYNGADDNGSGTTGMLAVAEALAAHGPMERSILLLWVSGEEKGLLGSQAWCAAPTLPEPMKPTANINIDMIGRNAADYLLITPTQKLPQYNDLVRMAEANAPKEGFPTLGDADAYWARSDQKSFSDAFGIPVMFLFSDVHEDYHQPTDTPDKVDCDKIRRVARLVVRMLSDLQGDELF